MPTRVIQRFCAPTMVDIPGAQSIRESMTARQELPGSTSLIRSTFLASGISSGNGPGASAFPIGSTDGGVSWHSLAFPANSSVSFHSKFDGMLVAPNTIYVTTDGGQRWDTIPFPNEGDNLNQGHDYGGGIFRCYNSQTQRILTTRNRWSTFDSTPPIIPDRNQIYQYTYSTLAFGSGDTILAYGHHSSFPTIARTTDGGQNWAEVFDDTLGQAGYVNCVTDVDKDTIVAGVGGWKNAVLWSSDNGVSWNRDSLLCGDSSFVENEVGGLAFTSFGGLVGAFNGYPPSSPLTASLVQARFASSGVDSKISSEPGLHILPIPATSWITLKNFTIGRQVHLLDILGRDVLRATIPPSNTLTLDVSQLPRGMYMVMIEEHGTMVPAGRVILN